MQLPPMPPLDPPLPPSKIGNGSGLVTSATIVAVQLDCRTAACANLLAQSSISDQLLLIMQDTNMTQMISEPTRVTTNSRTLIDVLFTNRPSSFNATGTWPLTSSDHMMIFGEHAEKSPSIQQTSKVRCLKKCSTEDLLNDLSNAPWYTMDTYSSVDDMWDYWKTLFLFVLDSHAPIKSVRRRKDSLE